MVIYKTTNLINGKQYIGSSINNNPNYLGSGSWIKLAIKKYGKENFKKEIIEYCLDKKHLKEREEYWIDYYDAFNSSKYYNATKKYCGNSNITEEHKNKISQINKNNKYNLGKKHSVITKSKISQSNLGKNKHSNDFKQKLSNKQKNNTYALGNILTIETKDKISKSKKGHDCYKNNERNLKISQANKRKPNQISKTEMLKQSDIKDKYNTMSLHKMSLHYGVSVPTIRRFLKNNI